MPPRPRSNGPQAMATGLEARTTGSEARETGPESSTNEEANELAPPTYEQAAAAPPFRPGSGYSVGPAAPPRTGSLYTQQPPLASRGRGSGAGLTSSRSDGAALRGRDAAGAPVGRRKASSRQSFGPGQTPLLGANSGPAPSVMDEVPATTGEDKKDDERCTIM